MPDQPNQIGSIRVRKANWNLPAPVLFEESVRRGEGRIGAGGALVVTTGSTPGGRPTTSSSSATPPPTRPSGGER